MRENKGIYAHRRRQIFKSDQDTIKIQLVGYGLINAFDASQAGGGGVTEFISLTDKGKRQLIENNIVRKPRPQPEPC